MADITGYGTITVVLDLESVENCSAMEAEGTVRAELRAGRHEIALLMPADPTKPVTADYEFNWIQGRIGPDIQTGFLCRLPFADGLASEPRSVAMHEMSRIQENARDYKVWEFPLRMGETIYPIRKGEVIRIEGFMKASSPEEALVASSFNRIHIEHPDGTISYYTMLDNNSLQIAEGQVVYPDTPLAKAGALSRESYGVRFALYYYAPNMSKRLRGLAQSVYIDPIFSTTDGNATLSEGKSVTPKTPKSLIKKEKPKGQFWRRLFGRKDK